MSPHRSKPEPEDHNAGGGEHAQHEVTNADLMREMRLTRKEIEALHQHIVNAARPQDGLLMRVHRLEQNWATTVKVFVAGVLLLLPAVGTALILGIKAWLHNDQPPSVKP